MANEARDAQHRFWVEKYRETGDLRVLDKLVDAVDGLKHKVVRGFTGGPWNDLYEDYVGEANTGLIYAAKLFDDRKGSSCWVSYAGFCMRRAILKHIQLNPKKRYDMAYSLDDNEHYKGDMADPYRFEEDSDFSLQLEKFTSNLSAEQNIVLVGRLAEQCYHEIAPAIGVTYQRANQHMRRIGELYLEYQKQQEAA